MYIDPTRKILRHPRTLQALREGEQVWPINIEFDLSDRCNLNCTHCAFAHTRANVDMTLPLAEKILTDLALVGVKSITLTGAGEPTMCPDFPAIVKAIKQRGFALGMYTNGIRYFPRAFAQMDWLYISLDAHDKASFREIKGVDGFDKVLETALSFREEPHDTVVGVGFLLGEHNVVHIPAMAGLGIRMGADYVQFRPIVGLESYEWTEDALYLLDDLHFRTPIYYPAQRFLDLRDKPERGYSVCRASALVPCVGAEGELWVCPNTRSLRSLGNLAEHSFAELWRERPVQMVGEDCREMCRNHRLNQTLEYVCSSGPHDDFV